jgi:hypothetical protein
MNNRAKKGPLRRIGHGVDSRSSEPIWIAADDGVLYSDLARDGGHDVRRQSCAQIRTRAKPPTVT